jgi:hypothetical protein
MPFYYRNAMATNSSSACGEGVLETDFDRWFEKRRLSQHPAGGDAPFVRIPATIFPRHAVAHGIRPPDKGLLASTHSMIPP